MRMRTSAARAARSRRRTMSALLADESEDRGPELRGVRVGVPVVGRLDESGEVAGHAAVLAGALRTAHLFVGAELTAELETGEREGRVAVHAVPGMAAGVAGLVEDRQQHGLVEPALEVPGVAPLRRGVAGRGVQEAADDAGYVAAAAVGLQVAEATGDDVLRRPRAAGLVGGLGEFDRLHHAGRRDAAAGLLLERAPGEGERQHRGPAAGCTPADRRGGRDGGGVVADDRCEPVLLRRPPGDRDAERDA